MSKIRVEIPVVDLDGDDCLVNEIDKIGEVPSSALQEADTAAGRALELRRVAASPVFFLMPDHARLLLKVTVAVVVGLAFAAMVLGLEGLGTLDWRACLENSGNTAPTALRVAQMGFGTRLTEALRAGIVDGVLQWPIVSHPIFATLSAALLFVPPFALALPAAVSDSPHRRRAFAAASLGLFLATFWAFPAAMDQHDCDRKGNDIAFLYIFIPLLAFLLAAPAVIVTTAQRKG